MATETTNLSLRKPATTDNVDVLLDIAGNMDKIDNAFGTATGHDHDGTDSKKVDPSNLAHKVRGTEMESTADAQKIATDNLKDLAVTNAKIATGAVASANIATGSIVTNRIVDANVLLAKLLSNTISVTAGTAEATAAHGLSTTPLLEIITMTSAGTIHKSTSSDGTNIFLTADAADRTCDVTVIA